MNKKISSNIAIISLAIILALGLLFCSNAKAQWGWGPQYGQGGWVAYNFGSPRNSLYGNGISVEFSVPEPEKSWAGWNDDGWVEFIEILKEKYPDLEGIDWEGHEDWDEDDWNALRDALQEVRLKESLENFIEDVTKKFAEYDNGDWETFNTNFFVFLEVSDEDETNDTKLIWAGFTAIYGCFDTAGDDSQLINCWKDYVSWTDDQWEDFRGIYSEYLEYEWAQFNDELQERLESYYDDLADWEDWHNWSDEDWEAYLNKYSDFKTGSYTGYDTVTMVDYGFGFPGGYGFGNPFGGPGGFSFFNPGGFVFNNPFEFSFGSSGGYGFGGYGGYGLDFSGGYGFGRYGGYATGFPGGYALSSYGIGAPPGYAFGGTDEYGIGAPAGYGYGAPVSYYSYSGSWGGNEWW